jgi:hypothetical protein
VIQTCEVSRVCFTGDEHPQLPAILTLWPIPKSQYGEPPGIKHTSGFKQHLFWGYNMHNGNIMGIWYNGKQMRQQNSWVSLKMVELRPIYGQFNGKMMMNRPIWRCPVFRRACWASYVLRLWMMVISNGNSSLFDGTIYMFSLSHRENWPGLKHTSLNKKCHRTTMVFTIAQVSQKWLVTRPGLSSCSACSWKLWKREIMINH